MWFIYIILAYVLCYGITAHIVSPLQSLVMPEITNFAAIAYLPHGVRVLSVWIYGWKAVPALATGGSISAYLFRGDDVAFFMSALPFGILLGACSALIAFELLRLSGHNHYLTDQKRTQWIALIGVGVVASIINSIGQTIIHSDFITTANLFGTGMVFLVGDTVGLVITMFILMFIFRLVRRSTSNAD